MTLTLDGANQSSEIEGRKPADASINYFIGRDPKRWHTNVPAYLEVLVHNAWPGVDLAYEPDDQAGSQAVELSFAVRPGIDPSVVRLAFSGIDHIGVTPEGELSIQLGAHQIGFTRLRVFEDDHEGRHAVAARFVVKSVRGARLAQSVALVSIQVAHYSRAAKLIIDPTLVYSSYLGGDGTANSGSYRYGTGDWANAVAIDSSGNEYLTGATTSPDFPNTNDKFSCATNEGVCNPAFVVKLDSKTGAVVYSTFLGGSFTNLANGDEGKGIAVNSAGEVYVAGVTYTIDFPTTLGAYQSSCFAARGAACLPAAFVTKLSADGAALQYSTLIVPTPGGYSANAIAIDELGDAYVSGAGDGAAFVSALNPTGSNLTYNTELASSRANAIAVTPDHHIFIGGQVFGNDFPRTSNAYLRKCKKFCVTIRHRRVCSESCGDQNPAFVAVLNPSSGTTHASLLYSTLIGGSIYGDAVNAITVDSKGRGWAVGLAGPGTHSAPFGAAIKIGHKECPQDKCGTEAFLTVIDPAKSGRSSLAYSVSIAGNGYDAADSITLDGSGSVYIGGRTSSTDFPLTSNAVQSEYKSCATCGQYRGAAFVAVLQPDLRSLEFSTYLGGAQTLPPSSSGSGLYPYLLEPDDLRAIAIDSAGIIHAAGLTYTSAFPITDNAQQLHCKACTTLGSEAFISRIDPTATTASTALKYSSYLGGSGPHFAGDAASSVAIDGSGNVYVAGQTASPDFPTTTGVFQAKCLGCSTSVDVGLVVGGANAFVAKLDLSAAPAAQLVYATYMGDSRVDGASGLAVDSSGAAYIAGSTSSPDFPTTPTAYQPSCTGCFTSFFTKLENSGSSLAYSTFLGGSLEDRAVGVAIGPSGHALIAGYTSSKDFPITAGAFESKCVPCGQEVDIFGGFVAAIDPAASGNASLLYSTYLTGSGFRAPTGLRSGDSIAAIAADGNGNAVVTGQTTSLDFPVTTNAFQPSCPVSFCLPDAGFVTVINPSATGPAGLVYSSYLGGTKDSSLSPPLETPLGVQVDANQHIVVGGATTAIDFPTSTNAYQPQCHYQPPPGSCTNGFLLELNPNLAPADQLVYGTYLGGSTPYGNDTVTALSLDATGRIYAVGHTLSKDFPVTPDAAQAICPACTSAAGVSEGFLSVLDSSAVGASQLVYSTFLGGSSYDSPKAVAAGSTGLVAVVGLTASTDYPTTANALQSVCPSCRNHRMDVPQLPPGNAFIAGYQF